MSFLQLHQFVDQVKVRGHRVDLAEVELSLILIVTTLIIQVNIVLMINHQVNVILLFKVERAVTAVRGVTKASVLCYR